MVEKIKDVKNPTENLQKMVRKLGYFFCLILMSSCSDPQRVYEKNIDFNDKIWTVENIPEFEFEITETSQPYNLFYNVRNSISYPYHNLYVKYSLEDSLGNVINSKLQNMDLFDPVTGEPYGEGLGDIFDHRILAIESHEFAKPGKYKFKIQQFMRQDTLPMILSVGLRVALSHPPNGS